MRSLVIDANVFLAFAREEILGEENVERTASPSPLFNGLGVEVVAFLDSGGHIQSEWRDLIKFAPEWFSTWLAHAFAEGKLYEVDPSIDPQLAKRYRKIGFPSGKDIWYIKTAHGLVVICHRNRPCLVAEDIDFYDPAQKAMPNKCDYFRKGRGVVCKQLKDDGIDLRCIETARLELNL